MIPSERWAVWSLRYPLLPASWKPAALASPFQTTCCQHNQSFQIWSRELRPKTLRPDLAVSTCWGPLLQGVLCWALLPGPFQLLQAHVLLPPLPQDLMIATPTSSAGEAVCPSGGCGCGRGSAVIFHTCLCFHSLNKMGVVYQKWFEHSATHWETAGNSTKILVLMALTLRGEGQIADEINKHII